MCRAVRFRVTEAPKWTAWCHCASCRKHSGAPASVYVAFESSSVVVTKGEIAKYASSSTTLRGFCPRCGTTLTAEADFLPGELHFHVGAFDDPEEFVPSAAVFTEERLSWVRLDEPTVPGR